MKIQMKKLLNITLVLCGLIAMNGCDEIDTPLIELGSYRSDLYGPVPTFTPASAPVQQALLEDFTGHDCGNCPIGHEIAHTILETHPDDVALVAVHAGSLAAPLPPEYPADWTTPEGEFFLLTQVGVDEMPKGRINRGPQASTVFSPTVWATKVNEALSATPPVNLQINASYAADNNHLNVHVNSQWFENATGAYRLVILITESGILAPQLWYGHTPEYVEEYEHNHMLRGTVTGATGLTVATNPQAGSTTTNSYTVDWNSAWNAENCEIVAYITEGENGKVLNVVKQALVP
jgi:hypothetical protein